MNRSARELLRKHSHWQESRKDLTWEEKIRMVEAVRAEFAQMLPVYREGVGIAKVSRDDSSKSGHNRRRSKRR